MTKPKCTWVPPVHDVRYRLPGIDKLSDHGRIDDANGRCVIGGVYIKDVHSLVHALNKAYPGPKKKRKS